MSGGGGTSDGSRESEHGACCQQLLHACAVKIKPNIGEFLIHLVGTQGYGYTLYTTPQMVNYNYTFIQNVTQNEREKTSLNELGSAILSYPLRIII